MSDLHTDVHGLSGAYVLDALTDIERAAFARHLTGCETCAFEVAELRETAARLADGAWAAPPPRMRGQVLAQVRQTRQLPPGRAAGPTERDGAFAVSRWRRRTALAVAAGVLAAGAGAAAYLVQEQRVRAERAVAEAARAQTARMDAVLTAPDAVLRSTAGPGGGRVTVVSSASQDAAVAMLTGLPPRGPDRSYQLWVIRDTDARSAGVLTAGVTEDRRLVTGVRGADHFGVTVEPAGGSDQPTSTAVTVRL
jgi:anti-sigma factor RsiW